MFHLGVVELFDGAREVALLLFRLAHAHVDLVHELVVRAVLPSDANRLLALLQHRGVVLLLEVDLRARGTETSKETKG